MTVLGYIVLAVTLGWLCTVAVLAVRMVWRDSVRARREAEWAVHRERHDG